MTVKSARSACQNCTVQQTNCEVLVVGNTFIAATVQLMPTGENAKDLKYDQGTALSMID